MKYLRLSRMLRKTELFTAVVIWLRLLSALHGQFTDVPELYGTPAWFYGDPLLVALCERIEGKDLQGMQEVIQKGVDINSVGHQGVTPLLWAVYRFPEGVELLLTSGAEPNPPPSKPDIMGVGWQGFKIAPIHRAAHNLDIETLQLLLDYGADPNSPDERFRSPAWYVASQTSGVGSVPPVPVERQKQILELLIRYSGELTTSSPADSFSFPQKDHVTPLMEARSRGDYRLMLLFLKLGADPTVIREGQFYAPNTDAYHLLMDPFYGNNRTDETEQRKYHDQVVKYLNDRRLFAQDWAPVLEAAQQAERAGNSPMSEERIALEKTVYRPAIEKVSRKQRTAWLRARAAEVKQRAEAKPAAAAQERDSKTQVQ